MPERNFGSATEDFSNKYLDFLAQIYPGLKEDVPQNSYLIFSLGVPTIVIRILDTSGSVEFKPGKTQ